MRKQKLMLFIFSLAFILSFYYLNLHLGNQNRIQGDIIFEKEPTKVLRIIDGDTIETDLGIVRLIGINTPEKNERFFEEATDFLNFLYGKEILLVRVKENKDKYGRLLRYVEYKDKNSGNLVLINELLVSLGLAHLYYFDYDIYYEILKNKEENSRKREINIWKKSENECVECISLEKIEFGNKDEDCESGKEFVILKNNCVFSCNLTSWVIHDDSNRRFIFPKFFLHGRERIKIYNGKGENAENYFFYNNKPSFGCYALWNNDKDTFYLRDNQQDLVIFYRYGYK